MVQVVSCPEGGLMDFSEFGVKKIHMMKSDMRIKNLFPELWDWAKKKGSGPISPKVRDFLSPIFIAMTTLARLRHSVFLMAFAIRVMVCVGQPCPAL